MFNFGFGFGFILIIDLAFAWHIIRTGRSPLWIAVVGFLGPLGWAGYFFFAVLPDMMGSRTARRFAGGVVSVADPGRSFRQKKEQVELVGSADAKRALADEFVTRGYFKDAIDLYKSAMTGALAEEPSLLRGLARAELVSGDGASAQIHLEKLRASEPAAFGEDVRLDYARSLELQGKDEAACREYEALVPSFSGQEARVRYALLLKKLGQQARAQELFRAAIDAMKGAPGFYRRAQREWVAIAKENLD